jgi:flagellar motor protein MotB
MKPSGEILYQRLVNPFHDNMYRDRDDSSWVLSLSDLMSLLLIFFLVWTTLKIADLKRSEAGPSSQSQMSFSDQQNPLEGLKDTLMEFSPVKTLTGNIIIVLEEDISFDSASAALSQRGISIIKRIADKLKKGTHFRLMVLGHTDIVPVSGGGPWTSNFELSLHRAVAVASQLIAAGIPAGRITCQGLGPLYPAQDSEIPGKRRFNRRVELIIEPA